MHPAMDLFPARPGWEGPETEMIHLKTGGHLICRGQWPKDGDWPDSFEGFALHKQPKRPELFPSDDSNSIALQPCNVYHFSVTILI